MRDGSPIRVPCDPPLPCRGLFHEQPSKETDEVDPRAWDIAAYLKSNAPADEAKVATDSATIAKGARLFTGLGCVACHVAPDIDDSDSTLARVPLKFVAAKFRPSGGCKQAFLLKPEAHYAWIKMPNFHLTDDEAAALTGYLLNHAKQDFFPSAKLPPGDATKGKAWHCLNRSGV